MLLCVVQTGRAVHEQVPDACKAVVAVAVAVAVVVVLVVPDACQIPSQTPRELWGESLGGLRQKCTRPYSQAKGD